jgi:hypothetical protein
MMADPTGRLGVVPGGTSRPETPPGSSLVRSVLSSGTFTQPKSKPISMVQRSNILALATPQRPSSSSSGGSSLASSSSSISNPNLLTSNPNLLTSSTISLGVTPLGTPPASPGRQLLEAGCRAESPGHFTMQFSPEIQLLLKKSVSVSESTDEYERAVTTEADSGEWQRKIDERTSLLQRVASSSSLGGRQRLISRETSASSLRSSPEPRTSEVSTSSTHSSCESAIPVQLEVPRLLLPRSPRPESGVLPSGGVLESVALGRISRGPDTGRDTSRDTMVYLSPRVEDVTRVGDTDKAAAGDTNKVAAAGGHASGDVDKAGGRGDGKLEAVSALPSPKETVYDLDGITWETMSMSVKYGKQLASILSTCRNNLCRMGWRCWETEISCGGTFTEEPDGRCAFLHREPIVKTEESVAQFVLALSFLRRCIASKVAVSSDLFLRAIDNYVASGLEKHPCSVTMVRNVKDEIDVAAERYAKGLPLDPHHEERAQPHTERVQRGIIVAAALSLGCAKVGELLRDDYVSMVSGAAIPVYIEPPKSEYSASYVASPRRGSAVAQVPSNAILTGSLEPSTLSPRRASTIGLPPLSPSSLGAVAGPRRASQTSSLPATAASVVASSGKGSILKKIGGLFSPRHGSPRRESPRKPD